MSVNQESKIFLNYYFLLQCPRQCICDFCADDLWGVLASSPDQIHLQCLLLLGDPILLYQRAQDDHGERDKISCGNNLFR